MWKGGTLTENEHKQEHNQLITCKSERSGPLMREELQAESPNLPAIYMVFPPPASNTEKLLQSELSSQGKQQTADDEQMR